MGYTATAVAAVDGGAVRRLEVERLVVVDGRFPLVVRARGDLVVLERRLVVVVVARAVSEHGGDGAVGGRVDVRGAVGAGERACIAAYALMTSAVVLYVPAALRRSLTDQTRSLTPMCDMVSTRKSLYGLVLMTSGTATYGLM